MAGVVLDWSMARWAPGVCVDCGKPANLRDPATGASRHKPCAERTAVAPVETAVADIGPERAAKRRETVRHVPEGYPFDVARFRDLLAVWPSEPVRFHEPDEVEAGHAPAVESQTVVAMRALADSDPCPKGARTVEAALVAAGWAVRATYACVRVDGQERHSVALRARRGGRRAWAVWVDGKATGGQVEGVRGTMGITEWRKATGCAPTPKAPRKAPPAEGGPQRGVLLDLDEVAAGHAT